MTKDEKRKKQRAADKRFRLKNLQKCRDKDKRRYQENREAELARNKAYYPEYYKKHKVRIRRERRNRLHNISQEWFDTKKKSQANKCAICGKPLGTNSHIDHDHNCCSSRQLCGNCNRGILCQDCNFGLGRFKDDIQILQQAIEYLQHYRKASHGSPVFNPKHGRGRRSNQVSP